MMHLRDVLIILLGSILGWCAIIGFAAWVL